MRHYERSGVTLDQCSECRGIFLDRGELERIVDAENNWRTSQAPPPQPPQPGYAQPGYAQPQYAQPQYGYGHHGHKKHHKRRGSFFEELFD
jgi:Zn-finger nucleic acid-binding protein